MNPQFRGTLSWLVIVLVALWFLYLAYMIARHVGAWPFA
jgi:hypothetical protein